MKKLIRSLLWARQIIFYIYLYILLAIFAIIHTMMGLLKFPYSIKTRSAQLNSYLVSLGIRWILWIRCKIEGKEHINAKASIYVVKHQSEWETIYLQSIITRACFVSKKEILDIPLLGSGLRALEYIPIDRTAGIKALKDVINAGKNRLKRNISIVIFPEGTRVAPQENPKFHKSAMSLAKSTNAHVIPIAHNSGSIWPANTKKNLILPGTITMIIGEPLLNTGDINDLTERSFIWIKNKMQEIE